MHTTCIVQLNIWEGCGREVYCYKKHSRFVYLHINTIENIQTIRLQNNLDFATRINWNFYLLNRIKTTSRQNYKKLFVPLDNCRGNDIISCVNLVRVKYKEYLFHVILKNTNTHFTFIVVTSTNKIVINEEKQEKIVEYINCFTGEIYIEEEK